MMERYSHAQQRESRRAAGQRVFKSDCAGSLEDEVRTNQASLENAGRHGAEIRPTARRAVYPWRFPRVTQSSSAWSAFTRLGLILR